MGRSRACGICALEVGSGDRSGGLAASAVELTSLLGVSVRLALDPYELPEMDRVCVGWLVGLKLYVLFCWPRDLLVINGRISFLRSLRSMEIECTLTELM